MSIFKSKLLIALATAFVGFTNNGFAVILDSTPGVSIYKPGGKGAVWKLAVGKDGTVYDITEGGQFTQMPDGTYIAADGRQVTTRIIEENGQKYIEYSVGPSASCPNYNGGGGSSSIGTGKGRTITSEDVMKDNYEAWIAGGRKPAQDLTDYGNGPGKGTGGAKNPSSPTTGSSSSSNTGNAGNDSVASSTPENVGDTSVSSDDILKNEPDFNVETASDNAVRMQTLLTFVGMSFLGDFLGNVAVNTHKIKYKPDACKFMIPVSEDLSRDKNILSGLAKINEINSRVALILSSSKWLVANSLMLGIINAYTNLVLNNKDKFSIDDISKEFKNSLFESKKLKIFTNKLAKDKVNTIIHALIDTLSEGYKIYSKKTATSGNRKELRKIISAEIEKISPTKVALTSFGTIMAQSFQNTKIVQGFSNIENVVRSLCKKIDKHNTNTKGLPKYEHIQIPEGTNLQQILEKGFHTALTASLATIAFTINPLLTAAVMATDVVIDKHLSSNNAVNIIKAHLKNLNTKLNDDQASILSQMYTKVSKNLNGIIGRIRSGVTRGYIKTAMMAHYFTYINKNMNTGKSIYVLTNEFNENEFEKEFISIVNEHRRNSKVNMLKEKTKIQLVEQGVVKHLKSLIMWTGTIYNYLQNANLIESINKDALALFAPEALNTKKKTSKVKNFFKKVFHKKSAPQIANISVSDLMDLIMYKTAYGNQKASIGEIQGLRTEIRDKRIYARYKNVFNALSDIYSCTNHKIYPEIMQTIGNTERDDVIIKELEDTVEASISLKMPTNSIESRGNDVESTETVATRPQVTREKASKHIAPRRKNTKSVIIGNLNDKETMFLIYSALDNALSSAKI